MKKTNIIYWVSGAALIATIVVVIISMFKSDKKMVISDPGLFKEYISAYTNNIVSKNDVITIQLTESFANSIKNKKTSIMETYPDISGEVTWKENNIIEFKPNKALKSGEKYYVILKLGKLNGNINKELKEFIFAVNVKNQTLNVKIDRLPTTDRQNFEKQNISGWVKINDIEDIERVKSCIKASINDSPVNIELEKASDLEYIFTVYDITRTNEEQEFSIKYDGTEIGSKNKGEVSLPIPPLKEFKVIDIQVNQYPEQYINIIFSDPIEEQQLLDGIITLYDSENDENINNLKFIIIDNNIKIIPASKLKDIYQLNIQIGIKNIHSKKLDEKVSRSVSFLMQKPELLLNNDGVILPSVAKGQVISFSAVNIKAVDVRITKIYENNVLQFLQTNSLSGSSYLDRVGKVVKTKTIDLRQTDVIDFDEWNNFYLNVSDIVKTEPGAIYRIEISFRKENAIYSCEGDSNTSNDVVYLDEDNDWYWFSDYTYYNYNSSNNYDDYYYEDEYSYDYEYDYEYDYYYYNNENQENPCKSDYYGYKNAIQLNILASDIGLIGKIGKDNKLHAFVTNLITTDVVSGAKIEVYDYQQQVIGKSSTDNEGKAIISLNKKDKPHFLVATHENQKSYIKLINNDALSTSEFDVSGANIQDGTNAFIYTDRGAWRPGDSIYVGFIITEDLDPIPVGHPIVFEVRNPKNQEIYREVQEKNEKGFHVFKFKTDASDPTGYYYAKFTMGGKVFHKSLMVETIKPNRLNIDLSFDKEYLSGDGSVSAIINAKWLHGADAADLNADVNISLSQIYDPFPEFSNYIFYNQTSNFNFNTTTLFSGKTDNNGQIKTPVKFDKIKNAPGVLYANLTTKVYEKGGNFSIGEKSIKYYPYEVYIGTLLPEQESRYSMPVNEDLTFEIISVDRNQKLTKGERDVEMAVYFMESSWWYDYNDNKVDYITANYNNALSREKLKIKNGKLNTTLNFENEGYYLVVVKDLKGGHISAQRIYVSSYSYSYNRESKSESVEVLSFSAEKENYNVGEDIVVNIPTGSGKALISIENSSKVLTTFWQKTEGDLLKFKFKAMPEMAPNIYVNVTFIQAHANTKNDRPIRMYGIIPVNVEDPATRLNPVISMADELPAETKVKISISEKDGKPMTYTIAMVDEGLLNLTGFKTPDPWSHFFSKEALGVRTWDIYNQVIGAFTIDAGKMLSIGGGDNEMSPEDMKNAIRFKPMVRFIGPFHLDPKKSKTHEIQLPEYIGAVRTMVIAAEGNSFGSVAKTTPVTKPLMVLGTAPRVLGTQESFKVPVTIFAMKPDVKNVTVSVKTNEILAINGSASKNVTFNKLGEQYINFDLKSQTKTGIAKIELTAKSGNHISKYNIELDVRHVNNKATDIIDGVKIDKDFEIDFMAFGIEGTNETFLEIYSMPPINLESRLEYLISYPHGCVEQITSAAFPQLYLENLVELDANQKSKIQKNINVCLNKFPKYQTSNGGLSYWPGGSNTSEWGTNYAGHFMIEAEKNGYTIPGNLKTNWLKYQKEKASKWIDDGPYSQLDQAYRLYTLALAGQADRSAMNRLKESKISNEAAWRLAAAYAINGKENIAKSMISKLSTKVPDYLELSGTFGSTTRDKSMILETLTILGEKEKAFLVLKDISEIIGSNKYCNTQTSAYALLSISKFIKKYGSSNNIDCSYTINGKSFTAKASKPVYKVKLNINETTNNKFILKSNKDGIVYVKIVRKGIPDIGYETAAAENIEMTVKYEYLDGSPIDISNITQGTDFVATITLYNKSSTYSYLNNVALTQIFPSGWEIINSRMFTVDIGNDSYYTYQDIRDDRVLTYFDMGRGSRYTYRVMLNASYEGEYYLPSTSCETMYDNSNYARTKGMWVKVSN